MTAAHIFTSLCLVSMLASGSSARAQGSETPESSGEAPFTYGENGQDVSYEVPTVMVRVRTAASGQTLHLFLGRETHSSPENARYYSEQFELTQHPERREIRDPLDPASPRPTPITTRLVTVPLCDGNCFIALGAGLTYRLVVLTTEAHHYRLSQRPRKVRITERTTGLDVGIENRRAHRIRRTVMVASIAALGGTLMGLSYVLDDRWCSERVDSWSSQHRNQGLFWSGLALAVSPVLTFTIPLFTGDRTYVRPLEGSSDEARLAVTAPAGRSQGGGAE